MPKLESKTKENPRLEQNVLSDGRISLYLNYYLGRTETPVLDELGEQVYYESGAMKGKPKFKVHHNRKKEILNLYLIDKPRTPIERQNNRETLEIAQKIRFEREQELKADKLGYRLKAKKTNFLDYIQGFYDSYTKADKRSYKCVKVRFERFLSEEYPFYKDILPPARVDREMMDGFLDYLREISKGDGAATHWKKWKRVINAAVKDEILKSNPCDGVVCAEDNALKKDVLSVEEVETLIKTKYIGQNPNVRRAFIFTLYTGVRFCDVKELTFANVDYSNQVLTFDQSKTKGYSSHSHVEIPLNEGLLSLIGEALTNNQDEKIFNLPSHTACLKSLRHWVEKAGIKKHITWHCGRHSFATNILSNGANIKTVASLLGHSGLKYTDRYVRAVDSLKRAAIDSLPKLSL